MLLHVALFLISDKHSIKLYENQDISVVTEIFYVLLDALLQSYAFFTTDIPAKMANVH